jgi:NTP pyrophosphatase (non-canonical NTP hydrolase)
MKPQEYMEFTRSTAKYDHDMWKDYVPHGLWEWGEVRNQLKKAIRDDGCAVSDYKAELTEERRAKVLDELGDVLWYIARVADHTGHEMKYTELAEFSWSSLLNIISRNLSQIENNIIFPDLPYLEISITISLSAINELASRLGSSIEEIMDMNVAKLTDRAQRNAIHGEGDNR